MLERHLTWEGVGSASPHPHSFPTLLTPAHPLLQEETLSGDLQQAHGVQCWLPPKYKDKLSFPFGWTQARGATACFSPFLSQG